MARAAWDDLQGGGTKGISGVVAAMERLVREQSALHERVWSGLHARHQMILRLVASQDQANLQLTSEETLRTWGLGAKSTVQSAIESLVDSEHPVRHGRGACTFDDPFFRRWVQVVGLPDLGLPVPMVMPGKAPTASE